MLTEITGNIFTSSAPMLAHGVNCRGVFGAGFAKQVAFKYPEVRNAYFAKHNREGWMLGDVQVVPIADNGFFANLATQASYGSPKGQSKPFASLEAIHIAVGMLVRHCRLHNIERFASVRLGCGLGGLNWDAVRPVIERHAKNLDIEIYELADLPTLF